MKQGAIWWGEQLLVPEAMRTQHIGERLIGLLGRRLLAPRRGLLISPCNSVHTLGMRFPLDIIFLDADWRVVRTVAAVPPGRWCVWGGRRARHTLEVQAGWIALEALDGATLHWQG